MTDPSPMERAVRAPEDLAMLFHAIYEDLAPAHGWKTQERSRVEWESLLCPCLRCPRCGYTMDVEDERPAHPEDGLAWGCIRCGHDFEWWAVSGPFMDGRHITSAEEEAEWRAHDDAVHARTL